MADGEDQNPWALYTRGVKKLGEKEDAPEKEIAPEPKVEEKREPLPPLPPEPVKEESKKIFQPSCAWKKEPLDLRVERNMSLGDVLIEAKIDLHGKTEADAYDAFRDFIEKQQARGKRMLLVITGKGIEGSSVLKQNLPRWCDVPPFDDKIMAVRTAAQHHGGEGAYYVLLRKRS